MTTTGSNGRTQRKSLAGEIDRLDGILDGLDDALAGAVEMAVRDVTARVVREAVEATLREVLGNQDLLRAAAQQTQPAQAQAEPAPRQKLSEWLRGRLAGLRQAATRVKGGAVTAWSWCLGRARGALALARGVPGVAWRFRKAAALALGAGVLAGGCAYLAGPLLASLLCGAGGAALTLAGMVLWPVWRLLGASA